MADCCTPGTGFPSATLMVQLATNNSVVWKEICMIQQAILEASSPCKPGGSKMCVEVKGYTPMTFVNSVNSVDVITGGEGYVQDIPKLHIIPPYNSTGAGADIEAITNNSKIVGFNILNGGSNYQPIASTVTVTSTTGVNAQIDLIVNADGTLFNTNIVNAGTGYTLNDQVIVNRAKEPSTQYTDAVLSITEVGPQGEIVNIHIAEPGNGYEPSVATVQIVSSITPNTAFPIGFGFYGTVYTDDQGTITDISIDNGGVGYGILTPYLVINDIGTGATTKTYLDTTTGAITGIDTLTHGIEYTANAIGVVKNPITAPEPTVYANVRINTNVNIFGTDPHAYYSVWAGEVTDKSIQVQIESVTTYFKQLGYSINIISNPDAAGIFYWKICW